MARKVLRVRAQVLELSETQIQEQVAAYFAKALPPHALAFHPMNEGKRGWQAQRAFKKGGGVAGIPDWCILVSGRAIFVELKSDKGRLSDAQKAVHERIVLAGHVVTTCRSLDDVIGFLSVCGVPLRGRLAA
jgi:hypothetical protein